MEKRIDLERRARNANQITDLNLDNCRSTSIVGLNDEYTALESLSLINVGLVTLKGFPKLPNLKKLELSDNRILNGLNYLHTSPKLQYLNLSGNKIKDLEALKPLQEFKNLAVLDLFNNEATQIENYRDKIFEMLPCLKFLDGFDCNDLEAPSECDDEEENGSFSIEDDKQNAFNINGLEIDLDELEAFEKRIKAKREAKQQNTLTATTTTTTTATTDTDISLKSTNAEAEVDELDEYLKTLKLKEAEEKQTKTLSICNIPNSFSSHPPPSTFDSDSRFASMNFALFLYWFLAILNLASAAFYSEGDQSSSSVSGEDPASGEEFSSVDDEDNGDVSLSEVYNEDLEEDEDEWVQQYKSENDDDEESDEDDANESAVANADKDGENNAGADEPQARGKKRKHEG